MRVVALIEPRISICRFFAEKHWELPVDGPRLLVGWPESPGSGDEVMPKEVQNALCRSMTSGYDVVWLDGEILPDTENTLFTPRPLEWPGVLRRLFTQRPSKVYLARSGDAARVPRLFDALGFPWNQRGQISLLIPPVVPFKLERAQLLEQVRFRRNRQRRSVVPVNLL